MTVEGNIALHLLALVALLAMYRSDDDAHSSSPPPSPSAALGLLLTYRDVEMFVAVDRNHTE